MTLHKKFLLFFTAKQSDFYKPIIKREFYFSVASATISRVLYPAFYRKQQCTKSLVNMCVDLMSLINQKKRRKFYFYIARKKQEMIITLVGTLEYEPSTGKIPSGLGRCFQF